MKLRPVTKLDKRNIAISKKKKKKKKYNDVISANCDVIVFCIYGQFAAIRKPDSRYMVYKGSLTMTLYLTRTKIRNKVTLSYSFHTVALSKGTIFPKKY